MGVQAAAALRAAEDARAAVEADLVAAKRALVAAEKASETAKEASDTALAGCQKRAAEAEAAADALRGERNTLQVRVGPPRCPQCVF